MTLELADIDDVERVTSLANHTQVRSVDDELRVEQLLPTGVEWTPEFLSRHCAAGRGDSKLPAQQERSNHLAICSAAAGF